MARRFIILILLLMGSIDTLGGVDLGTRFSGQGFLTIVYVIVAWGLLLGSGRISKTGLQAFWPFAALVVWALTTMFWYTPSVSGFQNILCVASFIGVGLLAAGLAEARGVQSAIETYLRYGIWGAAAVYGWCIWADGFGTTDTIGARSFGIVALVGVAWYASKWRSGARGGFVLGAVLLLEIGASLSRLALVTALVILTLARVSATVKGWLWGLISLGLAIASFWWMFTNFEPLRDHFLTGDVRLRLGETAINVSGRTNLWRVTYESFLESPWVGKGAGSSVHLIENRFRTVGHPHNDYLRVLHDYGVVGLGLWVWAWARLLRRLWAQARASEKCRRSDAALQFAAFLLTLGMSLIMITDNSMTYVFAMAPLGVLVGAAMGAAAAEKRQVVLVPCRAAPAGPWPAVIPG